MGDALSHVRRTDFVQFDDVGLGALLAQKLLGGSAMRAIGFAEDSYEIFVSILLSCLSDVRNRYIPTALLSMISWALDFAADMLAGLALRRKSLVMKEMMGNVEWVEG